MEEAWFRIRGIPLKYREKCTICYVAGLAGKPLALDKNSMRNFSYVRVKLGCKDVTLVPNVREAELEYKFYDFQFSRELVEPYTDPALHYAQSAAEGGDRGLENNTNNGVGNNIGNSQTNGNGNNSGSANKWRASKQCSQSPDRGGAD